ncbi:sensor histidine kinase [Paenibacillus marinisediminis]
MSDSSLYVAELCQQYTPLDHEDIDCLLQVAQQMPLMADLAQADVFIDCLSRDGHAAVVVAWARPRTAASLYSNSVVGQMAYARHEPAVLYCLLSGQHVVGARGFSQEEREMQQNVVPILNRSRKVIGALIMERDISETVEQEKSIALLQETTEHLSETLLRLALREDQVTGLMDEGMILFDQRRRITYTNRRADEWLASLDYPVPAIGETIGLLLPKGLESLESAPNRMASHEYVNGQHVLEVKSMLFYSEEQQVGGLLLLRDLSALKEKEKEIVMKSAFIQEIHHRVKNNIQTLSGMLRLQSRRTTHQEVKQTYHDMIQRMNSIALVHDILACKGMERVELQEVLERLCPILLSSLTHSEQSIQFSIQSCERLFLETEHATTIALIVTELLQNSIVHGFEDKLDGSPHIRLEVRRDQDMITLVVADNGIGIQEPVREGSSSSSSCSSPRMHFGLNLVRTLIQGQFNGTFEITGSSHGTTATLKFKLAEAEMMELRKREAV